ncbi:hypothetical protein RAS2_16430 [Phycisphaerae bacterium RAS2]|nr:hypothetical protein RAS2_16430 [Phycisphaerae bacterium RAS2]
MAELGQDWDGRRSPRSPSRRSKPSFELDPVELKEMAAYTYREIADACKISKNTVMEVFKTQRASRLILEKLSRFFPRFKLRLGEADAIQFQNAPLDVSQFFAKDGWDLFESIRSLYLSGRAAEAHAISLIGLGKKNPELWPVCGMSSLYIATARDEPHYFVAAVQRITERLETRPRLDPVIAFLMATDLAKFELEHGESANAEPYYDALFDQYGKWEERLTPFQQAAALRGHGLVKTLRRKYRSAKQSLLRAAEISGTALEPRVGTLYRLSQLALTEGEESQSDRCWQELGACINAARISSPPTQSISDQTVINPLTLLGARLTYIMRPANQERPRQIQDELEEFVKFIDDGPDMPLHIFQNGSAQAAFVHRLQDSRARQRLLTLVKPRLAPESIAVVDRLFKTLLPLL